MTLHRTRILAGCFFTLIAVLPVTAHHGSAGYDTEHPIKLSGTVRSIQFINPHCILFLEVTMDNGTVEMWAVEGRAPIVMERSTGWTKDTFKPGTKITVIGSLPREGALVGSNGSANLGKALAYSPHAADLLKTKHVIQAGDIRLDTGEVRRFGMEPLSLEK